MEEPKILKDPPPPKYVVGFLFNSDFSEVVLIQKTKPQWQNGFLNGVGGKTEIGETAKQAMAREFKEETGVTEDFNWMPFASFHSGKSDPSSPDQTIACFTACTWDTLFYTVKTTTEEQVYTVKVKDIPTAKTVPNLKWLVPLARDFYREGGIKSAVIQF